MGKSEAVIIKKILAGEKELFSHFIDGYQRSVYNLAYRTLGNREDALDIAQETFLRAFKSLKTFDLERAFSPWIHQIAKNLCINQLKKRRIRCVPLVMEDDEEGEWQRQVKDPGPELEERAVVREEREDLLQAMADLPEKYRLPLILRHLHHCTYEEIGSTLNVPPGTVKTWIYRGRNILKDYFKANWNIEEGEGK